LKKDQSVDSFGRSRVSQPVSIFQSKQTVDNQPVFWDDAETSGTGTSTAYRTNEASTRISVGSAAGTRVRQTKRRFNYQPGKSQLILLTGVLGAGGTGITKRLGYFDEKNGLYFEQKDGAMFICKRSYVTGVAVDTRIPQAEWNIDGADGVYFYGNINFSVSQIFWINFEWLGVGSVQMGVVKDGEYVPFHQFNHANSISTVYMSLPNLPIRYEISNGGTGSADSMDCICSSVVSEGGVDIPGVQLSYINATGLTTLNDTDLYGLMAFRLKSTHLHATVLFSEIKAICGSTALYSIRVLLNPTVTGTAVSFSNIDNSALQVATPTSATKFSAGTLLYSLVGSSSVSAIPTENIDLSSSIALGSKIDGTADIIVVAVQRLSGTTETFYGSANWQETY
jgi:hypothetical protein